MSVNLYKIGVWAITVFIFITGNALAGVGARNISTQSATAYLSGGGRYAETQDADTVLSNPAGAAFMQDGFHFHFSTLIAANTWVLKKLDTGKEYEVDSLGLIPDLAATYKKSRWAGFFTITFPGGNGGGSYDQHPSFDYAAEEASKMTGMNLTAEDQEFDFAGGKGALSVGTAYKLNDNFSVGYAIRAVYGMTYVDASTKFVDSQSGQELGDLRLNQSTDGWGLGHSFCLLFNLDKFKIGLRFDPEVDIETTVDVESDDNSGVIDGTKTNDNLPPVLFSGASYQISPRIKLGGGFIYYWQKGINGDDEPITDKWDNAYEIQAFIESALSAKWELIAGFNFSMPGIPDEAYTTANTSFADVYSFSLGTKYHRPSSHWSIITGLGYAYYPDKPKTEADSMGLYERQVGSPPIQYYLGFEYN